MKNCPKIVNRGLKIDLHIHSIYSSSKDGKEKVKNGTIENLPVLAVRGNAGGIIGELCEYIC